MCCLWSSNLGGVHLQKSLRCADHRTRGFSPVPSWPAGHDARVGRSDRARDHLRQELPSALREACSRRSCRAQGCPTRRHSLGKAVRSCRRDLIPSFVNTLPRCPLDRFRTDEELSPDLGVREPVPSEPGDLFLLRGELVARLGAALADLLAGRHQLAAGAFGERLHPRRVEQLVGGAEPLTGIHPMALPAKPLPVEQMCTGELGAHSCLARCSIASRDRLSGVWPWLSRARERAPMPSAHAVPVARAFAAS